VEVDPMSSVPSPAPADKAKRTASLWEAAPGRWVLTLTHFFPRRSATDEHYHLETFRADWGRGYRLEKVVDGERPVYHVHFVEGGPTTCDCPGHQAHGHCKHAEACMALDAKGKLPSPPSGSTATPVEVAAPAAPAPTRRAVSVPATLIGGPAEGWDDL
jgi:hypothetical protein